MTRIFDISVPITTQMVIWPGDPEVQIDMPYSIAAGDMANVSQIAMGVHTGTHIDAPFHFLENGIRVNQLGLERLIGEACVVEIPGECNLITLQILQNLAINEWSERILFKTSNSALWETEPLFFKQDFCALTLEAAQYLVLQGVKLVGIDYLSIAPFNEPQAVHLELLRNAVIILESINLFGIPAGKYQLICLPLKLIGTEGAPARAVLIAED